MRGSFRHHGGEYDNELVGYATGYLTIPSAPVHLPSPPFTRYDNPAWRLPLGQILHNVVLETFPFLVAQSVGIAVLVAWCVQWANGRWRPNHAGSLASGVCSGSTGYCLPS